MTGIPILKWIWAAMKHRDFDGLQYTTNNCKYQLRVLYTKPYCSAVGKQATE